MYYHLKQQSIFFIKQRCPKAPSTDLSDGYEIGYSVQEDPVPVAPAELRECEAGDVQHQVQQVVHGQGAHQQVEVAHHLCRRGGFSGHASAYYCT